MVKQAKLNEVDLEKDRIHLKEIAIVLEAWVLKKDYQLKKETTLTHQTIYQESVGSVQERSQENRKKIFVYL